MEGYLFPRRRDFPTGLQKLLKFLYEIGRELSTLGRKFHVNIFRALDMSMKGTIRTKSSIRYLESPPVWLLLFHQYFNNICIAQGSWNHRRHIVSKIGAKIKGFTHFFAKKSIICYQLRDETSFFFFPARNPFSEPYNWHNFTQAHTGTQKIKTMTDIQNVFLTIKITPYITKAEFLNFRMHYHTHQQPENQLQLS